MNTLRNLLWLGFACLVLCACAKTRSPGGSSKTSFLALCNASCAEGLSCLCGVCTEMCDSNAACKALSDVASCQEAASGCGTSTVCDVECSDDGDCAVLGKSHACEEGRCRAPAQDAMVSGGAGGTRGDAGVADAGVADAGAAHGDSGVGDAGGGDRPQVRACHADAVLAYLLEDEPYGICPGELDRPATDCAEAIQNTIDQDMGFLVTWETFVHETPTLGNIVIEGFFGVPSSSGLKFYKVRQDGTGFVGMSHPDETWQLSWTECASFTINHSCETIPECFQCVEAGEQECGCVREQDRREIVCGGYGGPNNLCKQPGYCLIETICYPSGETTEDGCCTCDNGSYSCIEPAWCPGWPSMGKRCDDENACGMGLQCRTDLPGEHGVCTRSCNYGCPTGSECFTNLGDYDDIPIGEGICLRYCESQDECDLEVQGEPLGSLCTPLKSDGSIAVCL